MSEKLSILITVTDSDRIAELKAVGARDLRQYFLPQAGVYADKLFMKHHTKETVDAFMRGDLGAGWEDSDV